MAKLPETYYLGINDMLARAWERNAPVIAALTPVIGAGIVSGGVVHLFGSGHSELIARDIIGRENALACVTGIPDPSRGFVENLPGYGTKLAARYDFLYQLRAGESIIVISNSGKNASPIDIALYAKEKGLTVVALTCLAMSEVTPSRHPSGRRLFECADFVLDNGGVPGDAIAEIDDLRTGHTSTILGCAVLNWLMLSVTEWLKANQHPLPIFRRHDLPGAVEHNRAIRKKYENRLSYRTL